jgi:3'-phosphoadenosine 5'-phosphosulfate sulfotransferase (PAPS reductase)/FAD synthetase
MLWKVLEANGGKLPDEAVVTFANTGKEMPQTLDFVQACSDNWGVDIVWLEFISRKLPPRIVDYKAASRKGEPFDLLTTEKNYLPNPRMRFCTTELKIIPIQKYMTSIGHKEFITAVGIRADEPRRVAKQKIKDDYIVPLADDGVSIETIRDFWESQPFGLNLPMMQDGTSNASNCDLCFLKGRKIRASIMRENPDLSDWWAAQEKKIGGRFRKDQISYSDMKVIATDQPNLFNFSEDESIPCFCGD